MKKLIDANALQENFDEGCIGDCSNCIFFQEQKIDGCGLIEEAPTVMKLPENASNGDVIKAVFNNDLHINHILSNEVPDWWEAPYKEKDNDK